MISKYRKYDIFMATIIGYMAEIEKMGIHRKPVAAVSNRSIASVSYDRLWNEVISRGGIR